MVDVSGIARLPKLSIEDISEVGMCERLRRLEAHAAAIDFLSKVKNSVLAIQSGKVSHM